MEEITLVDFKQRQSFVETEKINDVITRAVAYLNAGFPVHLRGPAGTGKTTLAMHLAHLFNQPTIILFGSDEICSAEFVGGQFGYRKKVVIDNYIHSVLKTDETVEQQWIDGRLVDACREGYILIYDEFSRSTPETNNVLLSVLEERVLELPINRTGENYIKVHPNFKAIFTSNPERYAGVYATQEALLDRMIAINLDHWDRETEIRIVVAKTGLNVEDAKKVVDLVRNYRKRMGANISVRAAIMIGKVSNLLSVPIGAESEMFVKICEDVLGGRGTADRPEGGTGGTGRSQGAPVTMEHVIRSLISRSV
ncbi:MAG: gas vesicle protein GvpN [Clostridiales bacterium]|nr:gas vesicle protein GvpN [Eubacteriales bacterium]MDH7565620.1 gas vesicle protein GvpN [Clostridiales bacterium]